MTQQLSSKLCLFTLVFAGIAARAEPDATLKTDAAAINTACAADAQTAGCGGEVVGKGLLKCLHNYRKATKGFKFRPDCQKAMKQLHSDKKAEYKPAGPEKIEQK